MLTAFVMRFRFEREGVSNSRTEDLSMKAGSSNATAEELRDRALPGPAICRDPWRNTCRTFGRFGPGRFNTDPRGSVPRRRVASGPCAPC